MNYLSASKHTNILLSDKYRISRKRTKDKGIFMRKKYKSPFLNDVIHKMHASNYSDRSIKAYLGWIYRYIKFHKNKHPREMSSEHVEAFLNYLAVNRHCSVGTQKQALNALAYLYNRFLIQPFGNLKIKKASKPKRLPVVLSKQEAEHVITNLDGIYKLAGLLMYGSGLRLMECLRLRIKDIDFERREIMVRGGKGDKDRTTILPVSAVKLLQRQIARSGEYHQIDLANGKANVWLPNALSRKYKNAPKEWAWQWLFPASGYCADYHTGEIRRHHIHHKTV
jgi:integron integrase